MSCDSIFSYFDPSEAQICYDGWNHPDVKMLYPLVFLKHLQNFLYSCSRKFSAGYFLPIWVKDKYNNLTFTKTTLSSLFDAGVNEDPVIFSVETQIYYFCALF